MRPADATGEFQSPCGQNLGEAIGVGEVAVVWLATVMGVGEVAVVWLAGAVGVWARGGVGRQAVATNKQTQRRQDDTPVVPRLPSTICSVNAFDFAQVTSLGRSGLKEYRRKFA